MMCSVIIVSKNNLVEVKYTVESLLISDKFFDHAEALIIDDSEDDDIRNYITNIRCPNIRWLKGDNSQLYSAMNIGISIASGKYIWFLNSGDRKAEDFLIDNISLFSSTIVYGNTAYMQGNQNVYNLIRPTFKLLDENQMKNALPCHQSILFERNFLEKHNIYYDISIPVSADYDFIQKCVHCGATITYLPIFFSEFSLGGISTRYKSFTQLFNHARGLKITRKLNYLQYVILIIKLCRKISFKTS